MWESLTHLPVSQELERDLAQRSRIEQELREKVAGLELQVADLIAANASLKSEIADHQCTAMAEQNHATQLLHEAERPFAMLGHELRNSLSAIAGAIQVMSMSDAQDAELSSMRQIIERQTSHMSRMVDNLLEQSRIAQDKPKVDTASQTLRILIIDDQRDASYPLRKLLELDGHRVEVAADGPTGIQAASQIQPQVVLCDIGLPGGMNGFEVAQALRTDPRISAALLVAVTGYGQEEDRRQSAAAGFDRHLTKPVGQSELRRLLSDLTFQRPS